MQDTEVHLTSDLRSKRRFVVTFDQTSLNSDADASRGTVSLREAFVTWARVATMSFGGPAGQIAVMHRIIVDEKKWISEERFLYALNYCMLLPGPEAQQLATYLGWLMHRTVGGLMAGILFILPGFASILALSVLYACYQDTGMVQALFFGLKPAIIAIVMQAVFRVGKRVLKNGTMVAIAAIGFLSIFLLDVPYPLLILSMGLLGWIGASYAPDRFDILKGHGPYPAAMSGASSDVVSSGAVSNGSAAAFLPGTFLRSVRIGIVCLSLWFGPLIAIWLLLGDGSVFFQEGVFFSKAAVVTFGGAYSVLAYIAQQAVDKFGWLQPREMLDGLGMAETTPGPLIMVVQFVGFMGAYRNPGPFSPMMAGILGSLLTTWVTFVPCFFWIFLGAPYIERLRDNKRLRAALSAITATVVGVILNLAIWFSLHTLFGEVITQRFFGLQMQLPRLATIDGAACAIALLACLLTFYGKKGMVLTLSISTVVGAIWYGMRSLGS